VLQDRYYQTDAVQAIWSYFQDGGVGNPVVAMPTGTGKSVVIARFLSSVFSAYPFQKVVVLTHVKELIKQNYEKLMTLWPFAPAGVYSAGLKSREHNRAITFAGIQSVWRKPELFGHVDLLLIDEVHLVPLESMAMYQAFIAGLRRVNPNLKLIGFTATPWRLGQGRIIDPVERKGELIEPLFTDICYDLTSTEAFNRLIAEGYLLPLRPKRTKAVLEADGIHMRGGEFIESELQDFIDAHDELTWQALCEARDVAAAEGRHCWLVFATGIRHANVVGQMLDQLGVTNCVIHSKSEDRDRDMTLWKGGHVTAAVNNNVLTTGVDNPLIDLILMLRQTASTPLWVQMLGRGTRPLWAPGYDLGDLAGRLASIAASGKRDCRVLDYAGNTRRLGAINDPVIPRRRGEGGGDAPVKACDRCDEWIHASLRTCPHCGFEFKFETKLKAEASSQELVRGDDPIVEVFKVDHVTAEVHEKLGKPPSLKLTYYSGLRMKFTDYLLIEHGGYMTNKARRLWSEMGGGPMPESTLEASEQVSRLTMPTHLRVWVNKQYPEILARCYDGTAFGTEEACEPPTLEGARQHAPIAALAHSYVPYDDLEDDVPF
jgi:DNA repair protein RadD